MPKFRGDSEDWLDDESEGSSFPRLSSKKIQKKGFEARSNMLPSEEANAVVTEVLPNQCRARMDASGIELICSYRRAEVVSKSKSEIRQRSPVAVGDRVLVKATAPSVGQVEGIAVRRNFLYRPAPGRSGTESSKLQHVIAANVDELAVVASVEEPVLSPGLVDRYLIAAGAAGIHPILCVTKVDLIAGIDAEATRSLIKLYQDLSFELFEVSSFTEQGIDAFRERLVGRSVVFSGQSGVGKTSLLSKLLQNPAGRVGEVNRYTGKGRHTTTAAVMIQGPGNHSNWIDTPGIREFGLSGIEPSSLAKFFPEFGDLGCVHARCHHLEEEGCDARLLPRYASYRKIFTSLCRGEG